MAICMDEPIFYLIIIISLIVTWLVIKKFKEMLSPINFEKDLSKDELVTEIRKLKDLLHSTSLQKQLCERNLKSCENTDQSLLPGQAGVPKRIYTTDTTKFYQIGYVSNDLGTIFPLFGRRLYRQRSDKWEYYIIEGSENKVRIPITTKNDQELSDGDPININGKFYTVHLYPYQNVIYNPI